MISCFKVTTRSLFRVPKNHHISDTTITLVDDDASFPENQTSPILPIEVNPSGMASTASTVVWLVRETVKPTWIGTAPNQTHTQQGKEGNSNWEYLEQDHPLQPIKLVFQHPKRPGRFGESLRFAWVGDVPISEVKRVLA